MRDALGIPKITYKLPFLKGRFALAAKVIQDKNDRQPKPYTSTNIINDATSSTSTNEISSSSGKSISSTTNIGDNDAVLASFQKQIKRDYPIAMWCEDVQQTQNRYNYRLFHETDKCCLEHRDGCRMVIPSGMMWNQLKNLGIYTR